MTLFTKPAIDIFAPTDLSGNPRMVDNGEAQVWGTEVEQAAGSALADANGNLLFDTMADAAAANIPDIFHGVMLRGKNSRGDGLGGQWLQDNNGSTDTFTSANGRTFYRDTDVGVGRISSPLMALINGQNSPLTYNATGNGTTDDSTNYALAEAANDSIYLNVGKTFNLGTDLPTKPVYGPGSLKSNSAVVDGFQVGFDAINSNILFRPNVYAHTVGGDYNGLPPNNTTEAHYNVVLAPGFREGLSSFPADNEIRRSVFVGVEIGKYLTASERDVAIGNAALKYAKFSERNTLVGTLTGQWLAINPADDPTGNAFLHDLLYNQGVPISDPAWDAYGLKTARAAIQAEIAAFSAWATTKDDVAYNCFFGRDAGVELVKGTANVGVGYRALSLLFNGADNAAVGDNALFMNVWGNQNSALGKNAGWKHQIGDANAYVGRNAGFSHVSGSFNVQIGNNAGNGGGVVWSGDRNVILGNSAGTKTDLSTPASMSDRLFVQNLAGRAPLLHGEFENFKLGINVPVEDALKAPLDLRVGGVAGTLAYSVDVTAGGALLESNTHTGFLVITPDNSIGGIYFGDTAVQQQGGVTYNHANDQLRLRIAGVNQLVISSSIVNSLLPYNRNGVQVVDTRKTGWAAATGTPTRTTFATGSVTLPVLAEHVKALIDDLISHGLIGA
ncbi:hypothetical protein [Rhizobium mongolense]|uniref:Uncharacterized protein n=1 Tax=Rhizobium mongolense TaxID=57676 RepID=A0A7W6RR43_9HYPH|nr:hypothetical protein [Rhizobium mongolense]MBB4277019.1 hypothetical protein [Rhizobium mongolense]